MSVACGSNGPWIRARVVRASFADRDHDRPMQPPQHVTVLSRSPDFTHALSVYLESLDIHVAPPGGELEIVVTTTSDCSAARCGQFGRAGVAVVVLAAFPEEGERHRYEAAGAEYVPMTVDARPLRAAIARIRSEATGHRIGASVPQPTLRSASPPDGSSASGPLHRECAAGRSRSAGSSSGDKPEREVGSNEHC